LGEGYGDCESALGDRLQFGLEEIDGHLSDLRMNGVAIDASLISTQVWTALLS
jgi:hypothetical protein